jgi:hypothetical protein
MRLRIVLASFAAVIGLAAPAQADPGGTDSGPDATFLAALHRAGITIKTEPTPSQSAKRHAT